MKIEIILFYILLVLFVFDFVRKNFIFKKNEPKGPWTLPLFGNLLMVGERPHRAFNKISYNYGGVFRVYLGSHYCLIISDPCVVRQVWNNQFLNFSNRPHPKSYKNYSNNFRDLAFADYELWKRNRQLVSGAFTKTKINKVGDIIEKQTRYVIDIMKEFASNNKTFPPSKHFSKFVINIICGMMFSKEISPNESVDQGAMAQLTIPIQAVFKKLGANNPDDFISILSPFFYFSNRTFKRQVEEIYKFIEGIYDEHLKNLDPENPKDQMDLLIMASEANEKKMVIHTAMDFLLAGSDSSCAVLEWFCLFLINNKDIQKKAYQEIVDCVGKDARFVPLCERQNCNYLISIFKEILRYRPVGPLGIPRVASESTDVINEHGEVVHIPKGTQVYQNIYGLAHKYVDDPETFKPERWIEYQKLKDANYFKEFKNGADHQVNYFNDLDKVVIPFSVGARNCIGMSLYESVVFSLCSNILLNFEFDSVDSSKLDDLEVFGLTIHAKPFSIKLTPRF